MSGPSGGYGAAALRGEAERVRSAPAGQRNHTLNAAAYSLGQLVAADALARDRVVESLTAAAQSAGLAPAEIAATIDSGLTAGAKNPRMLPPPPQTRRAESVEHAEPQTQDQQQQQQADEAGRDTVTRGVLADVDRAFAQVPALAIQTAARLVAHAAPQQRPDLLREAAARIADLVDVDGIDGQAALDALTAASVRVGMARTEVEAAISAGFAQSRDSGEVQLALHEQEAASPYRIDEIDAAHAGWLFAEAWESWSTDRKPCYPADTLRAACEWEGLPTLGQQDRRFGPRRPAPYNEAPGEELVDRDVYYSWSQAQVDSWHARQAERRRAAVPGGQPPRLISDAPTPAAAVTHGSTAAGAEETASPGRKDGESALDQPADADALVPSLLAVPQSRGVIHRAAWDATVTAVAERSAAAEAPDRVDRSALDTSDRAATNQPSGDAPHARDETSAGRPEATRDADPEPDPRLDRVDPRPRIDVDASGRAENLTDITDAEPRTPQRSSPEEPYPVETGPAPPTASDKAPDPHTILEEAIGQAQAAVTRVEANQAASHESRDEAPDAVVHHDRPAYWAEPQVEL